MGKEKGRKQPHRGRRKKGGVISGIILVIALVVFCVSGFNLLKYGKGYLAGRSEYRKIRELAVDGEKPGGGFVVNFDELLAVNPDTVGWIRFYPEPAAINYPLVQGEDNDKYLHKTFSEGENTLGAIFVAAENRANLSDKNTIIYGHRMNDRSMFYHLEDYKDQEFYKQNPYFYIYTPDGVEHTYRIYSISVVDEFSDTYITEFASKEKFQQFLSMTKETSLYDTGVEVDTKDKIVTLSTCTSADDSQRNVVRGVLEKETNIGGN
ncbi:class B sortase [Lachnospiraceae bacterium 42-17]|jgi:SrtB family sortase|nr:class B sortase [Dorea sp.]